MDYALLEYMKTRLGLVINEIDWYAKAEYVRQNGFYVDYDNKLKTPLSIEEHEYTEVLNRVNTLRSAIKSLKDFFESDNSHFKKHSERLKIQFLENGWYTNMEIVIALFKDRKINPLDRLIENMKEFSEEIHTKGTIDE